MEKEQSNINYLLNLKRASYFDVNNTYPQLFQLLGYRRGISEMLLRFENIDNNIKQSLDDSYEHVNKQIKNLLGLD